jgi:glycerol uptake facilitator-like aquaporin
MAFGFGITVLAGNLGAYSGGHVNPAVTLALMITRACPILDGAVYIVSQFAGAVLGLAMVWGCTSQASFVPAPGLNMEEIQPGYQEGDVIEAVGYPPFGLGPPEMPSSLSSLELLS